MSRTPFFLGSELPRLLLLAVVAIAGWGAVWHLSTRPPAPKPEPPLRVRAATPPVPIEPDRAMAFETVTDRTSMSFRDNAAYVHLLEKVREQTPQELAAEARRDVLGTHLWERPEAYRGVPIHLQGAALRVLRFESKLSKTGWLYEVWIVTPDSRRFSYACIFEEPPEGFPLGAEVNERVVFNGYFLKLMKYEAGDVTRGAPVLIGRLGWTPQTAAPSQRNPNRILQWSLVALAFLFVVSFSRWMLQLFRYISYPRRRPSSPENFRKELPPEDFQSWLDAQHETPEQDSNS